jgi:glycosyltransferase involved in cell wall biosynthesis
VGEGVQREAIQEFVNQNDYACRVTLMGQREDIPELLKVSDLFVLSSRSEGLPYTIIEAMLAGLPVVATAVGGVPELVEDGRTGFLVPPGDHGALAEAIQRLLDDSSLRVSMGEKGREKALREFTLDRMLIETQEIYRQVLGGAGP